MRLRDLYEGAEDLPEADEDGVAVCPLQKKLRRDPQIQVSLVPVFAPRPRGETEVATVTVTNVGTADLVVGQAVLEGANAAAFALQNDQVSGQTLRPGASRTLEVLARRDAAAIQQATLVVPSNDPRTPRAGQPLEASAYWLRDLDAPADIAPDAEDFVIRYTVDDPRGGVGDAVLEILRDDTGAVLFTGAPPNVTFTPGANAYTWRGAVTVATDFPEGFVTLRRSPYRVRVTIRRAGGAGPLSLERAFAVKQVGELVVEVHRHDGAALLGAASVKVTGPNGIGVDHATVATNAGGTNRNHVILKGLQPGNYTVQVNTPTTLQDAQKADASHVWRLGPTDTGSLQVTVTAGQRASAAFTLTRYTKVQFIGFNIKPVTPMNTHYRGDVVDREDMRARCVVMKQAMEAARTHPNVDASPDVLKVFMAPEFYFRGRGGGYELPVAEEIMGELRPAAQNAHYRDWLFVFGTAIAYLKHGDGAPERYPLTVTAVGTALVSGVNLPTLTVQRDAGQAASDVGVCGRIPAQDDGRAPALRWQVSDGVNGANVLFSTRVSATQYTLTLASPGAPAPLGMGPISLVEPLATEVFNLALVRRGGPNVGGGPGELLVYKEFPSAIDFLGANFGNHPQFHAPDGGGRVIDIHANVGRPLLPTEGAVDLLSVARNPSVTGGVSEFNRGGLGGGSLFTMAGMNFGLEVCRDHLVARLANYRRDAPSAGDPMPQVQLVPSWGASINGGSLYTVQDGLVFNVDGPRGSFAAVVDEPRGRCIKAGHNTLGVVGGLCADGPHEARCDQHIHFQPAGNATCTYCGGPAALQPFQYKCVAAQHSQRGGPNCMLCGQPAFPRLACNAGHTAWVAGNCAACGLLLQHVHQCPANHEWRRGAGNCTTCGVVMEPLYDCFRNPHYVVSDPCLGCGAATLREPRICQAHGHRQLAGGNCTQCGAPTQPGQERLGGQRWTTYASAGAPVVVADATEDFTEQTVTTTVEVLNVAPGTTVTVQPRGSTPIPVPLTPPTSAGTGPGGADVWNLGTTGMATTVINSLRVVTHGTLDIPNVGTANTRTTTVTTQRVTTVAAAQAGLFDSAGSVVVFPVKAVPPPVTL